MKDYIINDFLVLKLENGFTNIYINGKHIYCCRFLICMAVDTLKRTFEEELNNKSWEYIEQNFDIISLTDDIQMGLKYEIDPKSEFWAHCSNLEAWYENEYDVELTDYLFLSKHEWGYSNGIIYILRNLANLGDVMAKKKLREYRIEQFKKYRALPNLWSLAVQVLSDNDKLQSQLFKLLINEKFFVDLAEHEFSILLKLIKHLKSLDFELDGASNGFFILEELLNLSEKVLDTEELFNSIDSVPILSDREESYLFKWLLDDLIYNHLSTYDKDLNKRFILILIRTMKKMNIDDSDLADFFNNVIGGVGY